MKKELLHREDARGLFVIGVLATILVYKNELAALISPTGARVGESIVLALAATWGSYAFLMAIGLSDDVFKPRVCSVCLSIARISLWLGVVFSSVFTLLGVAIFWLGQAWAQIVTCLPGLTCLNLGELIFFPTTFIVIIAWVIASPMILNLGRNPKRMPTR